MVDATLIALHGFGSSSANVGPAVRNQRVHQQSTGKLAGTFAVPVSSSPDMTNLNSSIPIVVNSMREAGATQQVAEFASRVAAGASLRFLGGFGMLLDGFREAGATQQATQLLDRIAAVGAFFLHRGHAGPQYLFGREPGSHPAGYCHEMT